MKTYVLIKQEAIILIRFKEQQNTVRPDDFYLVNRKEHRPCIALFASPVDAEIVRENENVRGKKYKVIERLHQNVQILFGELGEEQPLVVVILGFMATVGRALISHDGSYSLACMFLPTLNQENWLVSGSEESSSSVIDTLEDAFARAGHAGHIAELTSMAIVEAEWEALAVDAMKEKRVVDATETRHFEVFSVTRKAWR